MSGAKDKNRKKDSGFNLGSQKATEGDIARRKQTRTAVIVLFAIAVLALVVMVLNSNFFYRNVPALTADGQRFSITDMNFYNREAFFWYDQAVESARRDALLHRRALEAGLTLDAAAMQRIETQLENDFLAVYREWGFRNVDDLIVLQVGRGMNLRILRERMEFAALGQMYTSHFLEQQRESYTEAMLEEFYMEHRTEFDRITYRLHTIPFMEEEDLALIPMEDREAGMILSREEALEHAHNLLEIAEDGEAAFLNALQRSFAEIGIADVDVDEFTRHEGPLMTVEHTAYGDWLLNARRTAGDVTVIEDAAAVHVLYFIALEDNRYRADQVRHLLVSFDNTALHEFDSLFMDQWGQVLIPMTEEQEAEREILEAERTAVALAEAERILAEWRGGAATEESFIELVREYSGDFRGEADPGFYEVPRNSGFVEEFEEWATASNRRPGDVEIVETQFGFHIMFYIGQNAEMDHRHTLAAQRKSSTAYQDWLLEAMEAQNWNSTFFSRLVG